MNFGMQQCDDKNNNDKDGCSRLGIVEKDYKCSGGYPYSKDNCTYIPTEIIEVKANKHNDLIIKFNRPIQLRNESISSKDL
jgi:cysteine-rich repeat protein